MPKSIKNCRANRKQTRKELLEKRELTHVQGPGYIISPGMVFGRKGKTGGFKPLRRSTIIARMAFSNTLGSRTPKTAKEIAAAYKAVMAIK